MSYSNLVQYDLLDLVLGQKWPEATQRNFALKFMTVLSNSLGNLMEQKLNPDDLAAYDKLAESASTTSDQIDAFLQEKNPALATEIQEKTLELKRQFLLKFYNEMVDRTQDVEKNEWKTISDLASQDKWTEVMEQLKNNRTS